MKNNKKSIYVFLLEFVVITLVFALVSVVSVTMFSKGKILSDEAIGYNDGLIMTENIAEKMKKYDGENLNTFLDDYPQSNDDYQIEVSVESNGTHYRIYNTNIKYIKKDTKSVFIEINISSIGSEKNE